MNNLNRYNKFFVAAFGAALTWGLANYANDPDISKWLSLVTAIATALGVYQVRNEVL